MKQLLRKLLREALVTMEDFEIQDDVINSHHGQVDCSVKLIKDDVILAYADYSIFQGKIQIKYIETAEEAKGKGYGRELMKYLAKTHGGYENIERSSLTPSGANMRKKLDAELNFDYEKYLESQNKHFSKLNIELIKNPKIKEFLTNLTTRGYDSAWAKLNRDGLAGYSFKLGGDSKTYDFNDISDLSQWFKFSKTNPNDPNDSPSDEDKDFLGKLTGEKLVTD